MAVRWAKPISRASRAATLCGSRSRLLPTSTRAAAAGPVRWQLWRIQSMGEVEPCRSNTSVVAKTAALSENSSSRRSQPWRRWMSSAATSPSARPSLKRSQKRSMAASSASISTLGAAPSPGPSSMFELYRTFVWVSSLNRLKTADVRLACWRYRVTVFPVFRPSSPPGASAGDPCVVGILNPPNPRHPIQRGDQSPPASELPQHTVDRRRPLEPPPARLDRPYRATNLLAAQAEPLGQPFLLVGPRIDPARPIVALDPAREPPSKLALAVIDEDEPIFFNGAKLH